MKAQHLTTSFQRGLVIAAVCLASTLSALATSLPTASQLGLAPGTEYHFAFVSSTLGLPSSTNIADYDAFVQAAADAAGIGGLLGLYWRAIASTASVDAITHIGVQGPVFLVNGTKIADNASDLWDGTLDAALNITELGQTENSLVYTGTMANGFRDIGPLGRPDLNMLGNSGAAFSSWIALGYPGHAPNLPLYAISEPVPEPSSFVLLAVSALFGVGCRAFGRRTNRGTARFEKQVSAMAPRVEVPTIREASCKWHLLEVGILLSAGLLHQAVATPIAFTASDVGALSLAGMPNSVAESNAWNGTAGALGTIGLVDFEQQPYPPSQQTSLVIAPGVTLSSSMSVFTISNSTSNQFVYAFNTTPSGGFYAGLRAVSQFPFELPVYTFTFDFPIQAFGLYITGRGQGGGLAPFPPDLTFEDPAFERILLPFSNGVAGQFVGFTDEGACISSVSITPGSSSFPNLADSFAFDDVRWVRCVPEASASSLLVMATAFMATRRAFHRKAAIRN
ncbi:MAG: PEP-CTERM sorting domain-containing protein [Chthoniobacteraceae bacterium]